MKERKEMNFISQPRKKHIEALALTFVDVVKLIYLVVAKLPRPCPPLKSISQLPPISKCKGND
jgi:hypothetical protein